jgi:hypothetical protein
VLVLGEMLGIAAVNDDDEKDDALAIRAQRIGQIFLMLSSNIDGEVLAAVNALMKTIEAAGADIHAVADTLVGSLSSEPKLYSERQFKEMYQKAIEVGRQKGLAERPTVNGNSFHDVGPSPSSMTSWHNLAVECGKRQLRDQTEREFVDDMIIKISVGMAPTEKQGQWLKDIFTRRR